jgi:hypothetical protein
VSRMQRVKGAKFERRLTNIYKRAGIAAKRGIGQARAASEVPDVDVDGLWNEAKHHQLTNPRAALRQAQRDSKGSGRTPIAVCMDNGKPPIVTLELVDFLELLYAARYYVRGADPGDGPPRRPRAEWLNPPKGEPEEEV